MVEHFYYQDFNIAKKLPLSVDYIDLKRSAEEKKYS